MAFPQCKRMAVPRMDATAPRAAQAGQARSIPAITERAINSARATRAGVDALGQVWNLASCFPPPCSSTAIRRRAAPSAPSRTSRSQRSKSPPRKTMAPFARMPASTAWSHSLGACHCSLQIAYRRGRGSERPMAPCCPGSQAVMQTPPQPCCWLEQMQKRRQAA
jgi:hypothetical protein